MKATSLAALILLFSGCSNVFDNLNTPTKPKVNDAIETIEFSSIKSIADITSIGFEWQKVNDPKVTGYNFYRTDLQKDGKSLNLVKSIDNRYATHYVDKDLEPNTKYAYQISARVSDGSESRTTEAYITQTLPRIVPVSFAQAVSELPNRVKILWRPHPDKRIQYYRIEKYNETINEWIHLKTVEQRLQVEYIDTGLDNNTSYKYRVKAFTFNHVESAPTPTLVAKTKALPKDATNISVTNNLPKKINITWNASASNDIIKYEIHRSSYSVLGFSKIASVNADVLEYSDKLNDDGRSYYYKVIAIDKDHLESKFNMDPKKGSTLGQPKKPILTLAQIQGNKAILNWRAGDERAISYNVQKRIKINFFEYKTVNINNINDLRFEDTDILSGVEYKYSVQANGEFGLVSDRTDEASVTIPKSKSQQ
jgi:fibronectin type 3 domain-containing protein